MLLSCESFGALGPERQDVNGLLNMVETTNPDKHLQKNA
jgi:hypothetical protein